MIQFQDAHVIRYYLHIYKGRKVDVAAAMGISVETVDRRSKKYGINWRDFRGPMCKCKNRHPRCFVCKKRKADSQRERYIPRLRIIAPAKPKVIRQPRPVSAKPLAFKSKPVMHEGSERIERMLIIAAGMRKQVFL